MKITISQEGTSPISITVPEKSNEGLFGLGNKKRLCYSYDDDKFAYKTLELAARHLFADVTDAKFIDDKSGGKTNPSEKGNFFIDKKYASKLKETHELKSIEVDVKENKEVFKDIYGYLFKNGTITNVEKDTIENFAKKYKINYVIKDMSSIVSKRKQEAAVLKKITATILNKFKSYKGIGLANPDDEDDGSLKRFISGESSVLNLISWDAREGTDNKARDEDAYNEFMEKYNEILNELETSIKQSGLSGTIGDSGDWDEGDICYYSNNK